MVNRKENCSALFNVDYSYCPATGCTHNYLTMMLGEIIEELGIRDKTILVGPVGCSEQIVRYLNVDAIGAPHGRALSVATGIKRSLPDRIIITYQGDGDFASIGIAEAVHTAARGEKISTVWVNNGNYSMTGGQMSPTTLLGQKTTTTVDGRDRNTTGTPLHVSELLAGIEGAYFITREIASDRENLEKCRVSITKAIKLQMEGHGFNAVEVLGICPTNWHMSTKDSITRLASEVAEEFPVGVKKDMTVGGCYE